MHSAHPNRFFGLNPVSAPGSGPKEGGWNHDLPASWRDAVAAPPAADEDAVAPDVAADDV